MSTTSTTTINYEEIQQKCRCNWCRQELLFSEPITEANFIDVGKKWPALFCSVCLNNDFRRKQPKMVINITTYDEHYIDDVPDKAEHEQIQAAKAEASTPDEQLKELEASKTQEANKTEET